MSGLPNDSGSFSRPMRELSANGATQLRDAAQRAMSMTHSSGAAVALLDVNELVTCASCGESVPPVGARSPLTGFTGIAIRSGQALVCDDTQEDARVDAAVCREIRVFSMAVAPIKVGAKIEGVFAIFFNAPRAANRMRLAMLRTLADVAGAILDRERVGDGESTSTATNSRPASTSSVNPAAQPVVVPKPATSAPTSTGIPTPVVLKEITDDEIMGAVAQLRSDPAADSSAHPRTGQNTAVSTSPEKFKHSQPDSPAKPARLEPVAKAQESPAAAGAAALPATKLDATPALPNKPKLVAAVTTQRPSPVEQKGEEPQLLPAAADPKIAPLPAAKASMTPARQRPGNETPLFQSVGSERPRSRISRRILLPAAGIAAAVLVVAGFMLYRSPGVNARAATVAAQPTRELPKSEPADPEPPAAAVEVEAPVVPHSAQPAEPPRRTETVAVKKQVEESAPPKPVMVVRSATNETRQRAEEPLVEAPPAIAASASSSVILPAPQPGIPAAPASPRTSVFAPATLMQMTKPTYPPMAAVRRLQGMVVLQIRISREGKVVQAKAVKGDPILGQAAANAVKYWLYKPATRDGVPVESESEVSVNFKLPGQ